ncbi:MAG: ricin-type beta-trefoil lectin domain protein [Endozoicomonas sp.]
MNKCLMGMAALAAVFSCSLHAVTPWEDASNSLANGCYAIQSPTTGKFMKRYHKGGVLDDGLSYTLQSPDVAQAERFFFKAVEYSRYLIYDRDGRYLAGHQPLQASSGRSAGSYAEWQVDAVAADNGSYHFRLWNQGMARNLRHATADGGIFYSRQVPGEQGFRLVPANGCSEYPEAELNLVRTGAADADFLPGSEIRGFADVHSHLTASEFMGGKFLHGQPFHRYGLPHALGDGSSNHGSWGALDIIGNLMGHGDVNARHDTRGYPDFPSWPEQKSVSHQQAYYRWIERTHKAGLKLMVTHLVQNEVLCNAQKTINPAGWIPRTGCNTMDSIRHQSRYLQELQDYVDAQAGGPGKGFFRTVRSPQEARQVIAQDRLAVLVGIEASELFNCGLKDGVCTREDVDRQLDEVYSMGVRVIYPIHRFDNQFGATRIEDGFINVGQNLSTGRFFETKKCPERIEGQTMTNGFPLLGEIPVLKGILDGLGLQPQYDQSRKHCNRYGLTDLGVYLVNRLIDKQMLIELDHMSYDSADAVLKIAEARNYSGVISGHSHLMKGKQSGLSDLHERIAALGGIMAPYNSDARTVSTEIDKMGDLIQLQTFHPGVAIGSDVNGLAQQAKARVDIGVSPLQYPFASDDGRFQFERQRTGNRVFDYNSEGVAHYGLMADHIADIRQAGTITAYESLMNSAEAYLQMWERGQENTDRQYINPNAAHYFSMVDGRSGKCLDVPGPDDQVHHDTKVQLWACEDHSLDQKWSYNPDTGLVRNKANPRFCLDTKGSRSNGGELILWECDPNNGNQVFAYTDASLRPKYDTGFAIDANGTENGAKITLWSYHGQPHQRWSQSSDFGSPAIFSLVDARSGKCLDIPGDDNAIRRNANVQVWGCQPQSRDQKWYYVPQTGRLHNWGDARFCMDNEGDRHNDGAVKLWECVDTPNQRFDYVNGTVRPRNNHNFAVDVNGTNNGANVSLWRVNGEPQQSFSQRIIPDKNLP